MTHSDNNAAVHRPGVSRSLWAALALISTFMVVEVVVGVLANSLALLADAGHMVTDSAAIGLSLFAFWLASRPASSRRSFGFHRSEILAALVNALSLWLIAAFIFFEAARRLFEPPEVDGGLVLVVGVVGLTVNIAALLILRRSSGDSLNVEGAFLHVLGDLLGSLGVIAAGLLIRFFDWQMADPIFGIVIGVVILVGSTRLLWKVVHVLMEGTPSGLNLDELCRRVEQVHGIRDVHDIHAWTITSGYEVLSAHAAVSPDYRQDSAALLQQVRDIAATEFGIAHTTIQFEHSSRECEEAHHVEHETAEAGR